MRAKLWSSKRFCFLLAATTNFSKANLIPIGKPAGEKFRRCCRNPFYRRVWRVRTKIHGRSTENDRCFTLTKRSGVADNAGKVATAGRARVGGTGGTLFKFARQVRDLLGVMG